MDDPLLSLGFNVFNAKGVYAVLLGSGISRAAGVPTGWEVIQDIIRKVAHLYKEDAPDAETWFRIRYGTAPNYSDVLAEIAPSPSERLKLLQSYFEPTEEEQIEGRKQPTTAHRAIADLVAKGYIRVILTTNFDRLLERALVDVGVPPSVVSSSEGALGALPLAHASCTVIKVNGDYLDPRFRNTREELELYEPSMNRLLDQVFDEYGLIVCGWSADWDVALCNAFLRASSRRFTGYWATRGEPSPQGQRLIDFRQCVKIPIASADWFFQELADRVIALESFMQTDPLSVPLAVARAKRYLSDARWRISLYDLVTKEVNAVKERIGENHFPSSFANPTAETMLLRLKRYDTAIELLLQVLVCVTYWGDADQDDLVIRSFRRIAERANREPGMSTWLQLKRYPALVLLFGIGIAAIIKGKYALLRRILDLNILNDGQHQDSRVGVSLNDFSVIDRARQVQLTGRMENTPLSNYLFERMVEPMKAYLPDQPELDIYFMWFEYLYALSKLDMTLSLSQAKELVANEASPIAKYFVPVGRFGWNYHAIEPIAKDELPKASSAGFFCGPSEEAKVKLEAIETLVDRLVSRVRAGWGIY